MTPVSLAMDLRIFCGTAIALMDSVFPADVGDELISELEGAGDLECITPSPTSNGAQDTFYPDRHWSLGDGRRKVGHEGNE